MSDEHVDRHQLPPFPVDDGTLDLLWTALHPGPEAEQTSLWDFLKLMSELGGSDTDAVESEDDGILLMRDQHYTDHCVITALISEIRRLRKLQESIV